VHSPEDGRVTHKIGRGLKECGFKVSWVGFGSTLPETTHGIDFRIIGPINLGIIKRLRASKMLEENAKQVENVDVWLAVEPDSARVANRLRVEGKSRSVFDIHEMYHSDMLNLRFHRTLHPFIGFFIKKLLERICTRADLIMAPGITRLDPYKNVNPKQIVVRHCLSRSDVPVSSNAMSKDVVRIMHGKATKSRGTVALLRAIRGVKARVSRHVKVALVNDFARFEDFDYHAAKDYIKELGLQKEVEWYEPMTFGKMKDLLLQSDIGVIAYPRNFGVNSIPNRIFEYLSFGLPVVCPIFAKELEHIVKRYNCGCLVNTEDPREIEDAIVEIVNNEKRGLAYAANSRKAFEEEFNMDKELKPLVRWLGEK
jgi:glycosyltransferase involved in cell wall biosynthesis